MDPVVRSCKPADVAVIAAREPVGANIATRQFARQERGESVYLVAWDADLPIGSAELLLADPPEIRNLHVEAGWRGRGIATSIIAAAEGAVGSGAITIGVAIDNPDARRFYERLGYRGTGNLSTTSYSYVDAEGVERAATETDEQLVKDL